MASRKPITKKTRFEVFKRDRFKCQYCGRTAPDVVLEVDHIQPVSKGGSNDILNLITSCKECNRGKGATLLSDDTAVKKQREQIEELAEKKEQMEMMIKWRNELMNYELKQAQAIAEYISGISDFSPSSTGLMKIKGYIRQFSFQDVFEAVDISFSQYYDGTAESWNNALNKIGGICYNRRKQRENDGDL